MVMCLSKLSPHHSRDFPLGALVDSLTRNLCLLGKQLKTAALYITHPLFASENGVLRLCYFILIL